MSSLRGNRAPAPAGEPKRTGHGLSELPRFPLVLERIAEHMDRRGQVGLISVHNLRPDRFEERHGADLLDRLLVDLARFLRRFGARAMRHEDEVLETMVSGNAFVILLGPSRQRRELSLLDVRGACERLERALEDFVRSRIPEESAGSPFACGCTLLAGRVTGERLERRIYAALDESLGDALRRTRRGSGSDERLLRRVLDHGALGTVYQPVVDLEHARVIGYEALSRPQVGEPLAPDRLFRIAHRHDALWRLERLARERALAGAARLAREHLLFLNVDPDALQDPMLSGGETLARLERAGLSPSRVVLELTEHRALTSGGDLRLVLAAYRRRGFRIALDDVGAGYAGLSAIAEVAPDFIKLDMSLVRSVDRNGLKRGLVATVAEFSRRSRIALVAEGVEKVGELEALGDLGVRMAQGYLFARPHAELRRPDLRVVEELGLRAASSGKGDAAGRARMSRG